MTREITLKNGNTKKTIPVSLVRDKDGKIRISGQGAYVAIPRSVKGRGGYFADDYFQRLGNEFFGNKGKVVGEGIGAVLRAFGLGKYTVEQNSLAHAGALEIDPQQNIPRITNRAGGEVVSIRREEYIGDFFTATGSTPTGFVLDTFDINPGNPALFPWLNAIAELFEEYEFRGFLITMKTMASDVSTAQSLGTMFGAVQYNEDDPIFTNKQEILNYAMSNSVKISSSVIIPVECARKMNVLNHLYVAPQGVIPVGKDPKFYNLGRLSLGSFGCPSANSPIAEIYASYDIDLFKPKLTTGGELALTNISGVWSSVTATGGNPLLGLDANPDSGNFFPQGGPNFGGAQGRITLPQFMSEGNFLIVLFWGGGTGATVAMPTISVSGCTQLTNFPVQSPQNTLASVTQMMLWTMVSITQAQAWVSFSGGTIPTGAGVICRLSVTQINGAIVNQLVEKAGNHSLRFR